MSALLASLRLHVRSLVLLSVAGLAGSEAAAAPHNPVGLSAIRLSEIGDTCRSVVGVRPGFTLYDACVESLSSSAARLERAGVRQAAHQACLGQGEGSVAAQCELDAAARGAAPAKLAAAPAGKPADSFLRASSREVRTREQQACGRLGYDPTSGGFAACVASLDAALYAADHPQP